MRKVVVRRLCGFCQDYFEHLFNAYTLITYADYISPYLSLRCYNSGCVSGCIFRKTRRTNCNSASTGITASLQCTSVPSCLSHTHRHDRLTALGPELPGGRCQKKHSPTHTHPLSTSFIYYTIHSILLNGSIYVLDSPFPQPLSGSSLVFLLVWAPVAAVAVFVF